MTVQATDQVDTTVSDDTSTNEEALLDDDLEAAFDDDGLESGGEEVESAFEADDSAATDEDDDDEEESEEDVDTSDDASETEEEDDPAEADDVQGSESEADVKARNDEYARKRIAERDARQREQEVKKAQEDIRIEQYLKEAESDAAELKYREAEVQQHLMQRERVVMNTEKLEVQMDKAIGSIDLFRTGSPEVKEVLGSAIDEFVISYVSTDEYGNPLEVRGDLYQHLQKKADEIRKLTGVGARQSSTAKAKTKARTQSVPTRAPREAKKDEGLSAFEEEAYRYQSQKWINIMAVNFAKKYEKATSDLLVAKRKSQVFTNQNYQWTGVNSVIVTTLVDPTIGAYNPASGMARYGTPTEVEDTEQEWALSRDRAWTKTIDKKSSADKMMIKQAGKYLAQATKNVLVPSLFWGQAQ